MDIVELIEINGGTIFGGYVRDMIVGDKASDIDVFFDTSERAVSFIFEVSQRWFVRIEPRKSEYDYGDSHTRHYRIIFAEDETKPDFDHVDVVFGRPRMDDFDVNMLMLNPRSHYISLAESFSSVTLRSVFENIRQKKCMALSPRPERAKHMKLKGWEVTESFSSTAAAFFEPSWSVENSHSEGDKQ